MLSFVLLERPDGIPMYELLSRFNATSSQNRNGSDVEHALLELVRGRQVEISAGLVMPMST